jgi:hypothetical protein
MKTTDSTAVLPIKRMALLLSAVAIFWVPLLHLRKLRGRPSR